MVWAVEDTAEGVWQAYRAEGDGAVRMRLHGLWLVRAGRRVGEVAATVGVPYRTVQRWIRWYEAGGLGAVRQHQQGGSGPHPRLTPEQQEQVAGEVATGRLRSAAEIGEWIRTTFGVVSRPAGVRSLLERLRGAPKVPRPVHVKADLEEQERFTKGGLPPR